MGAFNIPGIFAPRAVIPAAAAAGDGPAPSVETDDLPKKTGVPTLDEQLSVPDSRWQKADGWANGAPFNSGWRADHVKFNNGIMTLELDRNGCPQSCANKPYASAEYRSKELYGHGLLEGRFKAAKGDGLVSSLFFYTGTFGKHDHHEIDIEILGKDPTKMQINYYTDGIGHHEKLIDLGFNASQGFHGYAILWAEKSISWYVDGRLVHTEDGSRGPLPYHAGKVMVNLWPGIGVDSWLNPFTYTGPVKAEYDWIRYTPAKNLAAKAAPAQPPTITPPLLPSDIAPAKNTPPSLPDGFNHYNPTPQELINNNNETIKGSKALIDKNDGDIKVARNNPMGPKEADQPLHQNFIEYLIQWLLQGANGTPDDDLLNKSLANSHSLEKNKNEQRDKASPYWATKISFIILSGNTLTDIQKGFIKKFLSNDGELDISKAGRFQLIESLYKNYLKTPAKGSTQEFEGTNLLLLGQMEFQLALLASSKEERNKYLSKASNSFKTVIENSKDEKSVKEFIKKRLPYATPEELDKEFSFSLAIANAMEAQVLLQQAGEAANPVDGYKNLADAYALLKEAAKNLSRTAVAKSKMPSKRKEFDKISGLFDNPKLFDDPKSDIFVLKPNINKEDIEKLQTTDKVKTILQQAFLNKDSIAYQEVRRFAAECLARMAFAIKDGAAEGDYQANLRSAKSLITGVLEWERSYREAITKEGKPALWLSQISAYAQLWALKIEMFQIGEVKGSQKTILEAQQRLLAGLLPKLVKFEEQSAVGLDPEFMAELKKMRAEALALQGIIAINLGQPGLDKLAEAKKILLSDDVLAKGSLQIRAEANLWLAKIVMIETGVLIEAGADKTSKEMKNELDSAATYARAAADSGQLRGRQLSDAYQAQGEIMLTQEDLDQAKEKFDAALKEFPGNFDAQASLADILNQQLQYQQARGKYQGIELTRAKLGLAEVTMRDKRDAKPIEEVAFAIFENEPAGSYLITRAVNDLIEAYSLKKETQDRIILIGNLLLGKEVEGHGKLIDALRKLKGTFTPGKRLTAQLYLKTAEALSWKSSSEAEKALKIPPDILKIIQNDGNLGPEYALLNAEIIMRKERKSGLIPDELAQRIIKSNKPELIRRLISDQIEELSYEKKFPALIKLLNDYLSPAGLAKLKPVFAAKGQQAVFISFKIELRQKLADALTWNKDYEEALSQLNGLLADVNTAASDSQLIDLKNLMLTTKAKILLAIGDVYSYNWKKQNFAIADDLYKQAAAAVKFLDNDQDALAIKIKVLTNHANLLNFKSGRKSQAVLDLAEGYYTEAENNCQSIVDEAIKAASFANIYYGKAKLEEQRGNRVAAQGYIAQANANKAGLAAEQRQQIELARTQLADAVVTFDHKTFSGNNGPVENEETIDANLPMPDIASKDKKTALTSALRMRFQEDIAAGRDNSSLYVGGKLQLNIPFLKGPLGAECLGKVYSTGRSTDPNAAIQYFRQPDILCNGSYWSRFATAELAGTFDLSAPKLNIAGPLSTAHANAMFNFSWTNIPGLSGLRVGGEYNQFNFVYNSESRERTNFSLATRFNLDLAEILNRFGLSYDLIHMSLATNWPMIELIPASEYYQDTEATGTHIAKSLTRGRASLGADLNLSIIKIPAFLYTELVVTNQFSDRIKSSGEERDTPAVIFNLGLRGQIPEVKDWVNGFKRLFKK